MLKDTSTILQADRQVGNTWGQGTPGPLPWVLHHLQGDRPVERSDREGAWPPPKCGKHDHPLLSHQLRLFDLTPSETHLLFYQRSQWKNGVWNTNCFSPDNKVGQGPTYVQCQRINIFTGRTVNRKKKGKNEEITVYFRKKKIICFFDSYVI